MESINEFPVGMRVLAVDDDPVCLRVLRALLEKCRYNVTVTTKAVVALKLLREDKDKFDLIISDVRMPDMDGFKLLELVGLEMDLPVIMISAFSDTEAVMKGIAHGACDYLVKPVRLEEIKNVWQHVVRRRKSHPNQHKKSDQNSEKIICTDVAVSNDPSDGKTGLYRKRKDPDIAISNDYDDEDDGDDECLENAETSTKKKPRVVWHIDLHSKFVAAVNQLGIEKAVPKKILELMNVEELTRENVASHLQKYRIFLKKMNDVSNCHDDILASLGGRNSSYLPMASLDDIYNRRALSEPDSLLKFASFENGVLARRLNSPNVTDGSCFGRQNVSSRFHFPAFPTSRMSHPAFIQNSTPYSVNNLAKLMNGSIHGSQHENLVKLMPSSLELCQLQQNKLCHEPLSMLPDSLAVANNPAESFSSADSTYIQRFQAPHENKNFKVAGFNSPYPGDIPFAGNMESALPFSFPLTHVSLPSDSLKDNILDGNSSGTNLYSYPNSLTGIDSQKQSDTMDGSTLFLPAASSSSTEFFSIENICRPQERLEPGDGLLEMFVMHDSRFNTAVGTKAMDASFTGQQNVYAPFTSQNFDAARSSTDSRNGHEEVCVDPFKLLGGCNSNDQCSIDELFNATDKQDSDMHSKVNDLILDGR